MCYYSITLFLVLAPSYVIIGSDKPSPIRPVGSNVTVTCTVGLQYSTVGDTVPLILTIHLSNPAGIVLSTTMDSVSGSTYTSRATISSFKRAQSGVYTCEAILTSPSSYLSESSTVTFVSNPPTPRQSLNVKSSTIPL